MGRGFRSEVWTGRLVADGVDTEAKTNRGPLRRRRTPEGPTPP